MATLRLTFVCDVLWQDRLIQLAEVWSLIEQKEQSRSKLLFDVVRTKAKQRPRSGEGITQNHVFAFLIPYTRHTITFLIPPSPCLELSWLSPLLTLTNSC